MNGSGLVALLCCLVLLGGFSAWSLIRLHRYKSLYDDVFRICDSFLDGDLNE